MVAMARSLFSRGCLPMMALEIGRRPSTSNLVKSLSMNGSGSTNRSGIADSGGSTSGEAAMEEGFPSGGKLEEGGEWKANVGTGEGRPRPCNPEGKVRDCGEGPVAGMVRSGKIVRGFSCQRLIDEGAGGHRRTCGETSGAEAGESKAAAPPPKEVGYLNHCATTTLSPPLRFI